MVKSILASIIISIPSLVFAQKVTYDGFFDDYLEYSRQDFINNKLTKIEAYSLIMDKSGKLQNDSIQLFEKNYDKLKNKLSGASSSTVYSTSGEDRLVWGNFETYYNIDGQNIKEIRKPKLPEEYGPSMFEIKTYEKHYDYDTLRRLCKETDKTISYHYSIYEHSKDTTHYHSIGTETNKYFYNSDNQKIQWYNTIDITEHLSTEDFKPQKRSDSVRCTYCSPRFLNAEWKYNLDKKLEEFISYKKDNSIYRKRFYFYDKKQRLIVEIDSSDQYNRGHLVFESSRYYTYYDTTNILKESNHVYSDTKSTTYFDLSGNATKQCSIIDTTIDCSYYNHVFEKNKLTSFSYKSKYSNVRNNFYYHKNGLLKEERRFKMGMLSAVIRYYYE